MKLPADFEGVFRFTNPTDEEFKTLWNSVEYTFPPMQTVPLIIPTESPENVQEIRKRFAKRLGEKYFFSSGRYYELNDLTKKTGIPPLVDFEKEPVFIEFVQKCLEEMPRGQATVEKIAAVETPVSEHTRVIGEKDSLKANATEMDATLNSLPNE